MSTQVFKGTPQKVIRLSLESGAHPDCIAGSVEDACAECVRIVDQSMKSVYDCLVTPDQIVLTVFEDLYREQAED